LERLGPRSCSARRGARAGAHHLIFCAAPKAAHRRQRGGGADEGSAAPAGAFASRRGPSNGETLGGPKGAGRGSRRLAHPRLAKTGARCDVLVRFSQRVGDVGPLSGGISMSERAFFHGQRSLTLPVGPRGNEKRGNLKHLAPHHSGPHRAPAGGPRPGRRGTAFFSRSTTGWENLGRGTLPGTAFGGGLNFNRNLYRTLRGHSGSPAGRKP